MMKPSFQIRNETGFPIEFTSSIPEAKAPSVTIMPSGEQAIWFEQPSMTSIIIRTSPEKMA